MKKLKKILLINWLYFSKEVIEVGDVNFLTGKNGAGKSTVIDALQIVLLGETNARNFNLAANERSQRTLDGYLRADMDENNPYSRRGKDFSTYIVCEFEDDVEHNSFVCGVMFDCRSDGSKHDHFFIYVGKLPENCFIEDSEAMDIHDLRKFLKQNFSRAEVYDTQWEYRRNMLSRWNVHNEQVLRMMKKAVSFRPIVDIQQFITENICDIPDKPDIEAMQQNIRNYKRHEQLAQQQEEKLTALQEISTLYREMTRSVDRWRVQSFLVQWAQKEDMQAQIDSRVEELLTGIPTEASDYEKVKYVFETLIEQVDYNPDAENNQNIISVFLNGETVCQGYACATQYLLRLLNIQCTIVTGKADGDAHAWNLVRMDGNYYYLDTTWGNSRYYGKDRSAEKYVNYNYLGITSEEISTSHQADTIYTLPECTATADNYYVHEGLYFDQWDPDAIGEKYAKAWENGQKKVSVKFATPELYEQAVQFFIHDEKISNYCDGITTMYYIENKEQKILSISF